MSTVCVAIGGLTLLAAGLFVGYMVGFRDGAQDGWERGWTDRGEH